MGETKVIIKLNIKPHLESRGLTQMELADKINVPQGTISRWVNNHIDSYNREILQKLMTEFDCDLPDLFAVEWMEERG